jgi:hypothetical protein
MPSQHAIELFALLNFAILGLSLLLQPAAWGKLFEWLRAQGEMGSIVYGASCLLYGSLIVCFHRVWFGLLMVLTLVGWFEVIKGAIYLVAPGVGLRLLAMGSAQRTGLYRIGGLILIALAVFIFLALLPGGI